MIRLQIADSQWPTGNTGEMGEQRSIDFRQYSQKSTIDNRQYHDASA